jgi:hypothetical protein
MDPRHRGGGPDLLCWDKLSTFINASESHAIHGGRIGRSGVKGRSALSAERLSASIAALRGFDIDLWVTCKSEVLGRYWKYCSERRTRHALAVRAVADDDLRGVCLGGEADAAAVAMAIDLHEVP